ncbi:hypothetical protein GQ43DRAFT_444931, partial [Delitschia confertaspora ATCC 74209]
MTTKSTCQTDPLTQILDKLSTLEASIANQESRHRYELDTLRQEFEKRIDEARRPTPELDSIS